MVTFHVSVASGMPSCYCNSQQNTSFYLFGLLSKRTNVVLTNIISCFEHWILNCLFDKQETKLQRFTKSLL